MNYPQIPSPYEYDEWDAKQSHDCDEEAWDLAWHTNDDGSRVAVHWCAVCGKQMSYKVHE